MAHSQIFGKVHKIDGKTAQFAVKKPSVDSHQSTAKPKSTGPKQAGPAQRERKEGLLVVGDEAEIFVNFCNVGALVGHKRHRFRGSAGLRLHRVAADNGVAKLHVGIHVLKRLKQQLVCCVLQVRKPADAIFAEPVDCCGFLRGVGAGHRGIGRRKRLRRLLCRFRCG